MIGLTVDAIHLGDSAEVTRVAAEADIAGFVECVGDHNPIHSDRTYAAGTAFKERIAPGIWTAGLISAAIGTRLPGPGTIYIAQDLKFRRPVLLGDEIVARVEVVEVHQERNRVRLRTVCRNQRGEEVLTGEALVMPSRTAVTYEEPRPGAGTLAAWALTPWVWGAQAAAVWSAVGLAMWSGAARWTGPSRT